MSSVRAGFALLLFINLLILGAPHASAQNDAVNAWLTSQAVQLKTVEAGHGFADMQPLKKVVGNARVVALGEATHGTREFFQLKHRMLEFLVSEMGFTIFGIEGAMAEAFDINEYVLTGQGDAKKALGALGYWTWETEEVLAMVEWMRSYNADPKHTKKVKFYGFDHSFAPRPAKVALSYLRKVDPEQAAMVDKQLATLANPFLASGFIRQPKEQQAEAAAAANALLARLSEHKQDDIKRTSADEWAVAEQHARLLAQYIAMVQVAAQPAEVQKVRDQALGDNVRWVMDREGPNSKMVVWAHNSHVAHKASVAMGTHLRKMFGAEFVNFGFAFNQGSFQAIELAPNGVLRSFTVGPGPVDSLDATLAATGLQIAALDLRALPKEGEVAKWFNAAHKTKWMGAVYSDQIAEQQLFPLTITELFDALFFVEKTTAARPVNKSGTVGAFPQLAAPTNLDFEAGEVGKMPSDWFMPASLLNYDFQFTASEERPHSGKRSGLLSRAPGKHYGEVAGGFIQRIDAAPYRGKQVKLRVMARAEVVGSESRAYLQLRVEKEGGGQAAIISSSRDRYPVTSAEWRAYEIVMDVPAEAAVIGYGPILIGDGKVWVDSVSVEAIEKH